MNCTLTPKRIEWLKALQDGAWYPWGRMPKKHHPRGYVIHDTNRTWRPMRDAGLIESEYMTTHWSRSKDTHFRITDAGREALAKVLSAEAALAQKATA